MKWGSLNRRVTGCILTAMLMVSGCADGRPVTQEIQEEVPAEYEEHMKLSIAYWQIDEAFKKRNEDKVLQEIESRFNVTFEPCNITWDDYYEKIKLWAQTDALPDIFVGAYRTENSFYQWVREGLLKEIPQELTKYPNLQRYLDSPQMQTCQVNGKTYCIFRQTYSEQAETVKDRTILYRWDLAQKAGITKEPENWDEFRSMIQAIIEADSEHMGIRGMTAKGYSMLIGPLFTYSIPCASTGGTSFYWLQQGEEYIPALFAGESFGSDALPTWQLIRDMYTEGTIEQDIILTTTSQAEEKFLSGKSAAICIDGGIGNTKTFENIGSFWREVHGSEFMQDVRYLDLMPSVDTQTYYTAWGYAWSETYLNDKISQEKLDRILAIYDFLLSEEGILLSNFGIQDETYRINEDNTITVLSQQPITEVYPSTDLFASLVCWNYGNEEESRFPDKVPKEYIQADEERVEAARACSMMDYEYACIQEFHQLDTDFSIDINNIFQRIMVGTDPVEEVWQDIIEEYRQKGLQEAIDAVNERMK